MGTASLIAGSCSSASHGYTSGAAIGRVLLAPPDCIRASSDGGFSNFGYMCFSGSPGKTGDCVRVTFSNGGRIAAGITRLPFYGSTAEPVSACSKAISGTFGEAIGLVSPSDPRCIRVALPYPGTKSGQLCAGVPLGTANQCVSILYGIGPTGVTPDMKGHDVLPASMCTGLRTAAA